MVLGMTNRVRIGNSPSTSPGPCRRYCRSSGLEEVQRPTRYLPSTLGGLTARSAPCQAHRGCSAAGQSASGGLAVAVRVAQHLKEVLKLARRLLRTSGRVGIRLLLLYSCCSMSFLDLKGELVHVGCRLNRTVRGSSAGALKVSRLMARRALRGYRRECRERRGRGPAIAQPCTSDAER